MTGECLVRVHVRDIVIHTETNQIMFCAHVVKLSSTYANALQATPERIQGYTLDTAITSRGFGIDFWPIDRASCDFIWATILNNGGSIWKTIMKNEDDDVPWRVGDYITDTNTYEQLLYMLTVPLRASKLSDNVRVRITDILGKHVIVSAMVNIPYSRNKILATAGFDAITGPFPAPESHPWKIDSRRANLMNSWLSDYNQKVFTPALLGPLGLNLIRILFDPEFNNNKAWLDLELRGKFWASKNIKRELVHVLETTTTEHNDLYRAILVALLPHIEQDKETYLISRDHSTQIILHDNVLPALYNRLDSDDKQTLMRAIQTNTTEFGKALAYPVIMITLLPTLIQYTPASITERTVLDTIGKIALLEKNRIPVDKNQQAVFNILGACLRQGIDHALNIMTTRIITAKLVQNYTEFPWIKDLDNKYDWIKLVYVNGKHNRALQRAFIHGLVTNPVDDHDIDMFRDALMRPRGPEAPPIKVVFNPENVDSNIQLEIIAKLFNPHISTRKKFSFNEMVTRTWARENLFQLIITSGPANHYVQFKFVDGLCGENNNGINNEWFSVRDSKGFHTLVFNPRVFEFVFNGSVHIDVRIKLFMMLFVTPKKTRSWIDTIRSVFCNTRGICQIINNTNLTTDEILLRKYTIDIFLQNGGHWDLSNFRKEILTNMFSPQGLSWHRDKITLDDAMRIASLLFGPVTAENTWLTPDLRKIYTTANNINNMTRVYEHAAVRSYLANILLGPSTNDNRWLTPELRALYLTLDNLTSMLKSSINMRAKINGILFGPTTNENDWIDRDGMRTILVKTNIYRAIFAHEHGFPLEMRMQTVKLIFGSPSERAPWLTPAIFNIMIQHPSMIHFLIFSMDNRVDMLDDRLPVLLYLVPILFGPRTAANQWLYEGDTRNIIMSNDFILHIINVIANMQRMKDDTRLADAFFALAVNTSNNTPENTAMITRIVNAFVGTVYETITSKNPSSNTTQSDAGAFITHASMLDSPPKGYASIRDVICGFIAGTKTSKYDPVRALCWIRVVYFLAKNSGLTSSLQKWQAVKFIADTDSGILDQLASIQAKV